MFNANPNQKISDKAVLRGMSNVVMTLKKVQTTAESKGVSVTVSGEPKVLNIALNRNLTPDELVETLKDCLNRAFEKSTQQVLEQATKELDNF